MITLKQIQMYKYIKGHEEFAEEHMLSATELARAYGLYTLNNNPNGLLVCKILAEYVRNKNLNIADYFYPHAHGVMRVYPEMVYDVPLTNFTFNLEENKEYYYVSIENDKKSKINYKYKKVKHGTVIALEGRRTTNARK